MILEVYRNLNHHIWSCDYFCEIRCNSLEKKKKEKGAERPGRNLTARSHWTEPNQVASQGRSTSKA